MNAKRGISITAACCTALACGSALAVPSYELGLVSFGSCKLHDINNRGQVLCQRRTYPDPNFGLIWKQGRVTALPTPPGCGDSRPHAINEAGQVAGSAMLSPIVEEAFVWDRGGPTPLNTLPGHLNSVAWDINNRGQVVGSSQNFYVSFYGNPCSTGGSTAVLADSSAPGSAAWVATKHAFLWEDGVMTDLGTLGGNLSRALAINNRGQVAGSSLTEDGYERAVLWDRGEMEDLGTLPGLAHSWAVAINDRGQVIGRLSEDRDICREPFRYPPTVPAVHSFLWEKGSMLELEALPPWPESVALDINNAGQIVGHSARTDRWRSSYTRACLWQDGVVYDLNDLIPAEAHVELRRALAINDRGQIAAVGLRWSGDRPPPARADEHDVFLLTPIGGDGLNGTGATDGHTPAGSIVPEPGVLLLLAAGLLETCRRRVPRRDDRSRGQRTCRPQMCSAARTTG